jgi:hypothetical protein
MSADGGVDHAVGIANIAVHDRQIALLHQAVGEQARQARCVASSFATTITQRYHSS